MAKKVAKKVTKKRIKKNVERGQAPTHFWRKTWTKILQKKRERYVNLRSLVLVLHIKTQKK